MTIRVVLVRLFTLGLVFFFASANHLALGQGAKVTSPAEPIRDGDRDHPKQREEWFMRGRRVPGQSAAALRHRAHQQKMQMRARKSAAQNTSATSLNTFNSAWTPLGPAPLASDASGTGFQDYGPVSGRATSVAIDAADQSGNTVYVGGAYGGVWKSVNAGSNSPNPASVTWTPVIDNQPTLAVGSIAIQPQLGNPTSVVLVGTGEANSSADSYYGLGFLRSTDGGNTWSLISTSDGGALSFKGLGATKIAFSRAQTNTVVASLATAAAGFIDGAFTQSTVRGLYTSTDAGLTWTHETPLDGTVPIDPTSATAVVYNEAAATFYAAIRFHGFYSSPDGLHWTRLTNQPGGSVLSTSACPAVSNSVQTPCPMYRGEFAVVPGRNEMYVWYVSISTTTGQPVDRGIWKSADGGGTWTQISETGLTSCGDSLGGCGVQQGEYNLELAAVPNGPSATDVYAGAINLFKCTLTSGPTCSGGSWLNLTHVYGCNPLGALAHVHPDQHGVAAIIASGKSVMYFANDGGVYRALDAFVDLTTGSCTGHNQFDSLNQKTLGSMTQFVSFSIDPNDANTILGGTQDNGSPASSQATTNTAWINVNGGDGGYNAITPSSRLDWFVSNPDVPPHGLEIDHCSLGANCHTLDFSRGAVVTSSQLGGDDGGFYFPYILDPQADHELIVGTCRVWRGPSFGGTYTVLSGNFEVGGSSICTGGEVNQVRALAAGGKPDSKGFSNVIYAGTDGLGPLDSSGSGLPPGGRVFVTTNAAGGPGTFVERTQNINPNSYPVSSIAIDTSDPTGQTAYVAIMGFGAPHVWQTSNAGQTWTDFTGNLPDAPANSLVVDSGTDPTTGTIFVGTDVGVFSSSTASSNWTEVGPLVPNASGFLPNVPVTALRMFTSPGTKKLRASTYGRGIWENVLLSFPDYGITISNSPQITFPATNAVFSGTITAANGYSSQVALSCTNGSTPPPSTCTPSPKNLTPGAGGTSFAVTTAGGVGDYSFNVHAVGADTRTVTHDSALALHIVDFNLSAPSPGAVTVNRGQTSAPITMQVNLLGSFPTSEVVALSCQNTPGIVNCNFSPSSVTSDMGNTVPVTLTLQTTADTTVGTSTMMIAASSQIAGNKTITEPLTLTVTAIPDYTLVVNAAPLTLPVGQQSALNGIVTAFNGYSGIVNLTCAPGSSAPPATCTLNPPAVTATTNGTSFNLVVNSDVAGNFSFNVQGAGTPPAATDPHTASVVLTYYDFQISNTSGSQTVKAGQPATYNLSFQPSGGFQGTVTYSCSGLPGLSECSFDPPQISAGSGSTNVTLSITTTAPIASLAPVKKNGGFLYPMSLLLPGLAFIFAGLSSGDSRRRRIVIFGVLGLLLMLSLGQTACGGGGGAGGGGASPHPGTIAGTYTITVDATEAGGQPLQRSATMSLTVQ